MWKGGMGGEQIVHLATGGIWQQRMGGVYLLHTKSAFGSEHKQVPGDQVD